MTALQSNSASTTHSTHPKWRSRVSIAVGFALLLLAIDQAIKIWIKTHMMLGESIRVTDWFFIYFTENPGMAFGWEVFDKMFLTLFRIAASFGIAWLISKVIREKYPLGFLLCLVAIFSGAVGNIIDSVFYGHFFSHSYGQVASFLPEGGGYSSWLHGKVVDMLYFPLINSYWPSWVPWLGGEELIFFRPIFNFADACISVGVVILILCYTHSFTQLIGGLEKKKPTKETSPDAP